MLRAPSTYTSYYIPPQEREADSLSTGLVLTLLVGGALGTLAVVYWTIATPLMESVKLSLSLVGGM